MTNLLIIEPLPIAAIEARGSGAANLLTPNPKEAWIDSGSGGTAFVSVDLGTSQTIDTVFLGYLRNAAAGASWTITGGLARNDEFTIQNPEGLRVPDVAGRSAISSHALSYGTARLVRYLRLAIVQPAGSAPLSAGVIVVGRAFAPALGREWGSGRRPIDTGTATPLPDGSFAVVEGVRKRGLSWTFGDLTQEEVDQLEWLALSRGETAPVLVIEDAARTAGLVSRIHYSKFDRWRGFERRSRAQTRWEISVEEWA